MSSSLIFLVIFIVGSLSAIQLLKAGQRFSYDSNTSKCLNPDGKEGLNSFEPDILFEDMNPEARGVHWSARVAQCIDFTSVKFHDHLGVNYNVLSAWDFRGSVFTSAEFSFNFIDQGLFAGSNVEVMSIGYGRIRAADRLFDEGDMPMPLPEKETQAQ